eukprot:gene3025-589_t
MVPAELEHVLGQVAAASEGIVMAVLMAADYSLACILWAGIQPRPELHARQGGALVQGDTTIEQPMWEHGITGAGELISVSDTGVDFESCFFSDTDEDLPIYPQISSTHRKFATYVQYANSPPGALGEDHGTAVLGVLAGSAGHPDDGLAKDARLFFVDLQASPNIDPTLDAPGAMAPIPYDITKTFLGIPFLYGSRISSASWGFPDPQEHYWSVTYEFDLFLHTFKDQVIVASAGNRNNAPTGSVHEPASAKNVIGVGATNKRPAASAGVVHYSCRGPTADGRIKPDLVAPGNNVKSAHFSSQPSCEVRGTRCLASCPSAAVATTTTTNATGTGDVPLWAGSSLADRPGTSLSCPFVSAAAALIRQYFREGYYPFGIKDQGSPMDPSGVPSGYLVKGLLVNSAEWVGQQQPPDNVQGFGTVVLDNGAHR